MGSYWVFLGTLASIDIAMLYVLAGARIEALRGRSDPAIAKLRTAVD